MLRLLFSPGADIFILYNISELFETCRKRQKKKKCLYPFQGHCLWLPVNSCISKRTKKRSCYFQYTPYVFSFLSFPFISKCQKCFFFPRFVFFFFPRIPRCGRLNAFTQQKLCLVFLWYSCKQGATE